MVFGGLVRVAKLFVPLNSDPIGPTPPRRLSTVPHYALLYPSIWSLLKFIVSIASNATVQHSGVTDPYTELNSLCPTIVHAGHSKYSSHPIPGTFLHGRCFKGNLGTPVIQQSNEHEHVVRYWIGLSFLDPKPLPLPPSTTVSHVDSTRGL